MNNYINEKTLEYQEESEELQVALQAIADMKEFESQGFGFC
jgi:hypothetical protein